MSTQLAVRMSDEQLADLDWIVVHLRLDSRAEAIREAIERATSELRRREIDRQYVEFYSSYEETEEERAESEARTAASIDEEPWQKWW